MLFCRFIRVLPPSTNGTQESFLDQWGNAIFGPVIVGTIVWVAAAA